DGRVLPLTGGERGEELLGDRRAAVEERAELPGIEHKELQRSVGHDGRGPRSISAISPKKSPAPNTATWVPSTRQRALPPMTRQNSNPGLPCSVMTAPSPTLTSVPSCAMLRNSAFVHAENSGTRAKPSRTCFGTR